MRIYTDRIIKNLMAIKEQKDSFFETDESNEEFEKNMKEAWDIWESYSENEKNILLKNAIKI